MLYYDALEMLNELRYHLDSLGQAIIDLFVTIENHHASDHCWFDNCDHNWLYWQNQVIPIDVFDPDFREISPESRDILESLIKPYQE